MKRKKVPITRETEKMLRQLAARDGVSLDQYAEQLIIRKLGVPVPRTVRTPHFEFKRMVRTPGRLLRAMAKQQDMNKRVELLLQDPIAAPILDRVTHSKGIRLRTCVALLADSAKKFRENGAAGLWRRSLRVLGYRPAEIPLISSRLGVS